MKKVWSNAWKASSQKRKQRKYAFRAPLHIKHKFVNVSLSKDLKAEHSTRSVPVRVGDVVEIMAGQFKAQSGKVTKVSLIKTRVYVEGAAVKRRDGTDSLYPIHPSNLRITTLDLTDKTRADKLAKVKEAKK
ncbi:MAG: 50S ribosomal protein L24 [Nanoarchaeales archaeon]|nr:50S ribosomal protein L24 [Nanoarchaeales archaeon]